MLTWPGSKGSQSNMVFTEHGMLASKGSCYDLKCLVALGSEIASDWNIPTIDMLVYLSGKNYGPGVCGGVIWLLYGYLAYLYIDILQQL